jgi:hypothetical protein
MATNRVLTTTQDKLLAGTVDTVLRANTLTTRVLSGTKKWAGEQMKRSIKVSKNTTGGSFAGFDNLSTSATDNRQRLAFDPKFYAINVSLPLDELSINAVSETKINDLMATEMQGAANDAADDLGTMFYGQGTGNGSKDYLGLGAIVDDGGDVATYGGLTRATFTTLNATDTASGGTLSLLKMRTLYNAITDGSQAPTLILGDNDVFSYYEQLLQPQERIAKDISIMKHGLEGGTGFKMTGLYFAGTPFLADRKAISGNMYMLNEDYLDFYALPVAMNEQIKYKTVIVGNDYGQPEGLGFGFSGWVKSASQAAITGKIYHGGNLLSFNPRRHGRLTGITGV